MNITGKEKIKERVKWIERYANEVDRYVDYITFDVDLPDELCQACGARKITKVAQFFHLISYNYETLEIVEGSEDGGGSPLQAIVILGRLCYPWHFLGISDLFIMRESNIHLP